MMWGRIREDICCPTCSYSEVRRSRPRWFELPLMILFLQPFRCVCCQRRFWARVVT
ncbi:MAG: hypothetical protein JSS27_13920 [Planctomycetes bacterium]|nr:hypothetical protein [Planctomycetota bacterium]